MSRNDAKRPEKGQEIPGTFESKEVDINKETGVKDKPASERLAEVDSQKSKVEGNS